MIILKLEKASTKKKIPKLKELKKPITIGVIISFIAIAGIVIGVIFLSTIRKIVFVYGVYSCPYDIDPLAAYGPNDIFELTYLQWIVDYNDPSNIINALYSNKKPNWNIGQVNDTQVQQWMEEGLEETNETAREEIYYRIQKSLIEEVYPNIWIWQWIRTDVYVSNLRGWYPNGFKDLFKFVYLV